jgi:hypothetical protein
MRSRIVVVAGVLVLLVPALLVALLIVRENAMFHGRLPPDTLATNSAQAEDVAYSVASNADCRSFENDLQQSADSWMYACRISDVQYIIYVFGSDNARSQGLAQLQADGRPYVAKAYYAVTATRGGVDKFAAMSASPPPTSIMDPFK